MPLYEYECGACGHRLEALQKISDEPLVYCPECNDAALKKQISAAAFRLKGTGWYETDFKGDKKSEAKSDSNSDKSSSSKPAADSSAKSSDSSSKKADSASSATA